MFFTLIGFTNLQLETCSGTTRPNGRFRQVRGNGRAFPRICARGRPLAHMLKGAVLRLRGQCRVSGSDFIPLNVSVSERMTALALRLPPFRYGSCTL
jgi:hypothetical protein